MTPVTRFRQGAGRLCLDFVRTLRRRGTPEVVEELPNASALRAWAIQCGPLTGVPLPSESLVREARALREAIHELLTDSAASGRAAVRQRLNRFAALQTPSPLLTPEGGLRWQADDPVTAILALLARDALDLAMSPQLARVRECANPRCGALFVDSSRPGTRRWCSMEVCGNQAKKKSLRAKDSTFMSTRG